MPVFGLRAIGIQFFAPIGRGADPLRAGSPAGVAIDSFSIGRPVVMSTRWPR